MTKLCSEPRYQRILQEYVEFIRDEYSESGYPRFEELSFLARKMPFFVYDNPIFIKECGDTAFTDNRGVYINKNFLLLLMKCDEMAKALGYKPYHVTFVLLHEVSHCVSDDFQRLSAAPEDLANFAQDTANNLKLQFSYLPDHKIIPEIYMHLRNAQMFGVTEDELEKYGKLSSETICLAMWREQIAEMKNQAQNQQQQNSNQSGNQQGQSGSSQNQQSGGRQPSQQSKPSSAKGTSADPTDFSQDELDKIKAQIANGGLKAPSVNAPEGALNEAKNHTISPDKLAEIADKADLAQSTKDALGLHPVRTKDELNHIETMSKMRSQQAALEMQGAWDKLTPAQRNGTTAGNSPGYYEEKVGLDKVGKITWKMAINEATSNSGTGKDMYIQDELIDDFYVNSMLYEGVYASFEKERGVMLMLIDTSGSMRKGFINDGFSEGLASVDDNGTSDGVKECLIFPADVDVKGKYWTLTEQNKYQVQEELRMLGGGGTDFSIPLKNALLQAEEDDKHVTAVVFITDLEAAAPDFDFIESEINEELPPIVFVTDKDNKQYRDAFEKACRGKAVVYHYEEGLVADIEEIQQEMNEIEKSIQFGPESQGMGMY